MILERESSQQILILRVLSLELTRHISKTIISPGVEVPQKEVESGKFRVKLLTPGLWEKALVFLLGERMISFYRGMPPHREIVPWVLAKLGEQWP